MAKKLERDIKTSARASDSGRKPPEIIKLESRIVKRKVMSVPRSSMTKKERSNSQCHKSPRNPK